ncbi:hypothetical protein CCHR01_12473 [Colletotrichum chrysophilum]|uniref:Uncharacterized protein n=1 Tax=Colletotrichum chrysophilum TaxID=1836956 RepID=A0AAD9ACK2_9PEZI|nr:hypothetical protein CCHR01_12473 [Colletotrichum chrysophilum]
MTGTTHGCFPNPSSCILTRPDCGKNSGGPRRSPSHGGMSPAQPLVWWLSGERLLDVHVEVTFSPSSPRTNSPKRS